MYEKSWKIELVFERGQMRVRLVEGRSQHKSFLRRLGERLITRLSWLALGLGIATFIQTLAK